MKLFYFLFLFLLVGSGSIKAQEGNSNASGIRPAQIGFGFGLYDFTTARRIRQSSLSATLNNKRTATLSEMAPGISVVYAKGLKPKLDFTASLNFASGRLYLQNKPDQVRNASFVMADAAINLRLLPEQYLVNPFVSAGVGASVTEGYYGAILPLGVGLRFRLSDETSIGLHSQYRVAVTETAGYHFLHGITIMGKL